MEIAETSCWGCWASSSYTANLLIVCFATTRRLELAFKTEQRSNVEQQAKKEYTTSTSREQHSKKIVGEMWSKLRAFDRSELIDTQLEGGIKAEEEVIDCILHNLTLCWGPSTAHRPVPPLVIITSDLLRREIVTRPSLNLFLTAEEKAKKTYKKMFMKTEQTSTSSRRQIAGQLGMGDMILTITNALWKANERRRHEIYWNYA